MKWISIDLKTLTNSKAGIGRYTASLSVSLTKNNKFNYFGITGPETELEQLKTLDLNGIYHLPIRSTLIRSTFLPFKLPNYIDLHHSLDNSCLFPLNNKIKKVTTIHDLSVFQYPEFFTKKHQMMVKVSILNAVKTSDHIITDSKATKKDLLNRFKRINPEKISVIYLATDTDKSRNFLKRNKLIQKNKLNTRFMELPEQYILSLSTMEPRKNLRRLITAFVEMVKTKKINDIGLVLVGDKGWLDSGVGLDKEELRKKNIITLGFVEEEWLPYLYANALAFIYPSIHEGFGLPPLEAMSYKTPVIISQNSSLPEVGGKAALYIDPLSIDSIKKAMEKIIFDQSYRTILSEKCFLQSLNFSWKKAAEETEKVYKNVLEK